MTLIIAEKADSGTAFHSLLRPMGIIIIIIGQALDPTSPPPSRQSPRSRRRRDLTKDASLWWASELALKKSDWFRSFSTS